MNTLKAFFSKSQINRLLPKQLSFHIPFKRLPLNLKKNSFIFYGLFAIVLVSFVALQIAFALNDTTHTWTFDSAHAGDYTYDPTLVTVDNSGVHPVNNVNKFSNPTYTSNVASWTTSAIAPSGWIEVPGNSIYPTTNFLVMKYEAKCANSSTPTVGLTTPADTGREVYYDNFGQCTNANSKQVVSIPGGYPIGHIGQASSISRCSEVTLKGTTAHLINNKEWMTIARNVEAQASNWSLGSVGSGYLFAGNNDNSPGKARIASTTDSNRCAYTDAAGTDETPGSCPSFTANGQSASVGNQVRTHNLSNGEIIWDLAGNQWEWTIDTIAGKDQPYGSGQFFTWREFPTLTNYGTLSYDLTRPLNPTYDSSYGVGRFYSSGDPNDNNSRVIVRGGGWNDGLYTGAFTAHMELNTVYTDSMLGFRCASDPVSISQTFSSTSGLSGTGSGTVSIGNVADGKVVQSINVGDTSTYNISVLVKDATSGNVGGTVSSSIAQLYYNGSTISTNYTNLGSGWWKLSGTLTGANASREYGLVVRSGKTVNLDNWLLSKQGAYTAYTTNAYNNNDTSSWDSFAATQTANGEASIGYQLCTDDGSVCESGNSWKFWDGDSWETVSNITSDVNTSAQLTEAAMQALDVTNKKLSVKMIFGFGAADSPSITQLQVGLTTDITDPTSNASSIVMKQTASGATVSSNGWVNNLSPYFSWTAGSDDVGGSGLRGYCVYIGTDSNGNPETSKGLLGTSPGSTAGSTCQFVATGTSLDFANTALRGSTWLTSSSSSYYINIKAIDNGGNVYAGSSTQFQFRFDNTIPTNVAYISPASGNFSNVVDMNFAWPTSGGNSSSDSHSGVLGWQYQINSTTGAWQGTSHNNDLNIDYIPTSDSSYTFDQGRDSGAIVLGNNVIYFRTIDTAGNVSSDATVRTGNISYGGEAPAFGGSDVVTVTPGTSTNNEFALSWPQATATVGQTVTHYYYMINTNPPSTLNTLQSNGSTYIDNGTSRTVSARNLPNVNKGSNTVYVVAIDNASPSNYSPSSYISGTFTLNSTDPDNVGNLSASDSSIKLQAQWNVTLTWTEPVYKGAGNLTYLIYRSSNNITFTQVGSSQGLAYVDRAPSSSTFYYKIYSKDGANALSSGTNVVSITPTGRWTSPAALETEPKATEITTRKAKITWSTARTSDSKVQYGTKSGVYNTAEISNSSQVTGHSIELTGLSPQTVYYYKAKWTDEDGNTGVSDEKSFTTAPPPLIKNIAVTNIGLNSAIIQYTTARATRVRINYGNSTSFGGIKEVATSTSESTYTTQLTGLTDGTKYYYTIRLFDSEGIEYGGTTTILDFTTLPRPKISNIRVQQVRDTAQSTVEVTWDSNTEITSVITYYPSTLPNQAKDSVDVKLVKGTHKMILSGLTPSTQYTLKVKGVDRIGNSANSDDQHITTASDTRPPQVLDVAVQGSNIPKVSSSAQENTAQLIISWNTDEPATSQVEFSEGTGATYNQLSQYDGNLTVNHLVVISGLSPSKVYHFRVISKDNASNESKSSDSVTITPKAIDNALDLVISNLSIIFGFLGNIGK